MNELVASLVLSRINTDYHWTLIVTAVSKKFTLALDKNYNWEEQFCLKCSQLSHAHFSIHSFVQCKHMFYPAVFDRTIDTRYGMQIHVDNSSPKSLARQVFPKLRVACDMAEQVFDDLCCFNTTKIKKEQHKKLVCGRHVHVGNVSVAIAHGHKEEVKYPDFESLFFEIEGHDVSSDDSFECSECGDEHHNGEYGLP
jgi:hypothetical protein